MRALTRISVGLLMLSLVACTADAGPVASATPSDAPASSPEATPEMPWALVGGGWSFGECGGWCVTRVSFTREGAATLTVSNWRNQRTRDYTGELTPRGKELIAGFSMTEVGSLKRTYGCPDCLDGGASELSWQAGSSRFTTTFEYGSPPAPLKAQNRLITRVIGTLWHCDEDPFVSSTRPFKACSADTLTR